MQGANNPHRTRIVDREVMKLNLREAARREAQKARRNQTREPSKPGPSDAR